MILTLTPNPSVDRTITVAALTRGAVQRATDTRMDPGGKGINVSRALALNGAATTAILPIGGGHGRMMLELLEAAGTPVCTVPIRGAIRANVALVEPDGTTTKINELGPTLDPDEVEAVLAKVTDISDAPLSWVVGCGSLPPGMPEGVYGDLVRRVHERGGRVAIDTSGAPLTLAIPAGPDLIKPNRVELGELVGRDLDTLGAVVEAARDLIAGGIGEVLVSLGRDGAVLVTRDTVTHAIASVAQPLSTVGAGDCTLAGYLLASRRGDSPAQALATAVAFGAAAVGLPGSEVPNPAQVAQITPVVDPDPDPAMVLTD
ncbi:MAG: 1-phosphofructokinase [Austwickia sp.]|nr:1-phosphofructokinase [Austwickia sp.]